MFSIARVESWESLAGFMSQALGTNMISAPFSIKMRALSGNSRSKQIISPIFTPSNSQTGKSSPFSSKASMEKSQVCTLSYRSRMFPVRSMSKAVLRGAFLPEKSPVSTTPIESFFAVLQKA